MLWWSVFECPEGKKGVLSSARAKMSVKAWIQLKVFLSHVTQNEPKDWSKKKCPDLRGGLYKLRPTLDQVERRFFFWLDRDRRRIVILLDATEKDWKYDPADAERRARERMDAVKIGKARVLHYDWAADDTQRSQEPGRP